MYITFLIGNGFDINLGLKTRYSDFYGYFKETAPETNVVLQWMQSDNDKGNWADLELALGDKLSSIDEKGLDAFVSSYEELQDLLLDYLESEQSRYSFDKIEEPVLSEVVRSLTKLKDGLTSADCASFELTCKRAANEDLQYNFISFNYTDILDTIIEKAINAKLDLGSHTTQNGLSRKHTIVGVHHVHGTLTDGIVLAVNDESQINNDVLAQNERFKDIFLKSRINHNMGQRRTEHAEQIIDKSQIVCIFGMSMGLTDKQWWEKIIRWLVNNADRKLIIYVKEDSKYLKRNISTYVIGAKENVRRDFWEKGKQDYGEDVYRSIQSRIFVVFNCDIFSFPKV